MQVKKKKEKERKNGRKKENGFFSGLYRNLTGGRWGGQQLPDDSPDSVQKASKRRHALSNWPVEDDRLCASPSLQREKNFHFLFLPSVWVNEAKGDSCWAAAGPWQFPLLFNSSVDTAKP